MTHDLVSRLMLRRDNADGISQHDSIFRWPSEGFVAIRSHEVFDRLVRNCGAGLYGYACGVDAPRMGFHWSGDVWRIWLADSSVVSLGDKAKAQAGHVLFRGSPQDCAAVIQALGGTAPYAVTAVTGGIVSDLDTGPIVARILADAERRAWDLGLWRIFRSIGFSNAPDVVMQRERAAWLMLDPTLHQWHDLRGTPSVEALAAYRAGWVYAYQDADKQALAMAGWKAGRFGWTGDACDHAWLLANPGATDNDMRKHALGRVNMPLVYAAASSLSQAQRDWYIGKFEAVRAVQMARKSKAVGLRGKHFTIAVWIGRTPDHTAPDGWIGEDAIGRMKVRPTIVRHDWGKLARKIETRRKLANARQDKRNKIAIAKADKIAQRYETERSTLINMINVKDGPKSWGRCTKWLVRLEGSSADRKVVYTQPYDMPLRDLAKLVADLRHV